VPERVAGRRLTIQLSGATVPASLRRIELEVHVGGQAYQQTLPPVPNQTHTFTWDGTLYGRPVQGRLQARVRVGYVYGAVYYTVKPEAARSFGRFRGTVLATSASSPEFVVWQEHRSTVGTWDARGQGLGAWTLSTHHAYAPHGQDLYLGDGGRRSARLIGQSVTSATAAESTNATEAFAVTPEGTLYVAATPHHRVLRVEPGGLTTVVVGTGSPGCGGPALGPLHRLNRPSGLAAGPGGTVEVTVPSESGGFVTRHEPRAILYIADAFCHQIHEVRPIGGSLFVQTIAGDGTPGYEVGALGGDEIAAVIARLNFPGGLAVGPDGSLYIADTGNHRIRRIARGPNDSLAFGIITTVAGSGVAGSGGDGGHATDAQLRSPRGLAVGVDGSLFIADTGNHRIRRVAPNGIITTVAGNGVPGFSGDDGLATLARLTSPRGVEPAPDGSLFVADSGNDRLRRVVGGNIGTVAGGDIAASSNEGVPAARARLSNPGALRLTPDRSLLVADTGSGRILRLGAALPGFSVADIAVASEDGGEVYQFDGTGRHLATRHALTGGLLQTFSYDAEGRLAAMTDGDGNVTAIERDGSGSPTAIVAPLGQRTTLALDGRGYLASLTNPAGETRRFTYHDAGGLLATHTDPRGGVHRYTHDALGYLVRDEDPAGGFVALARTQTPDGFRVTRTTAGGHVRSYLVEKRPDGGQRWETTLAAGTRTEFVLGANRSFTVTLADGTVTTGRQSPDPRFGMQAPLIDSATTATPGGLRSTVTMSRAVTLAEVQDPSSLLTLTETLTVNGSTFTFRYEAAPRTATLTTPAGRQESAVLDGQGRVVSLQVPGLAPREFAYDGRGRPTSITQGSGASTRRVEVAYDADGYPRTITASGLRALVFGRDAAGRVTTETFADGREVRYTHDPSGNVISISPPGRPPHVFAFTPLDLLASYTPPDAGAGPGSTGYTYDLERNLARITRADETPIDFEYDGAGRLAAVTLPRGRLGFGYHPTTGKLITTTAPDGGTLVDSYDGMLRTGTTWSGAVTGAVAAIHDADFLVASRSVDGAHTVTLQHDRDGELVRAGGLTITRDPLNGLVTGTTLSAMTDSRGYNEFGELISYRATAGGPPIYAVDYTRDGVGRIVVRTETLDGVTTSVGFVYDQEGRLQEVRQGGATVRAYAYDSNDNRQSVTGPGGTLAGTYDAQDRLLAYGAATYAYTADGELRSKTAAGQTTEYRYDELGNLLRVVLPGGAQIDYVVDGRNRRVGKRLNGTSVQGFLYADQLRPVAELDGSGAVVSRFVYGPDPNVPAYLVRGGVTYRIVSDHLGSPRLVVDVATGAIVQRIDYDEFGVVLRDTNPGFQPFGFAGGLYDADTRLTRFGVRDYDAETGRWTVKDPVGYAGGINLYGYVANDPVNVTDPPGTGIDPEPTLGPSETSKQWAREAMKEMKQSELAKKAREAAEAARKAKEATKGSPLLRWLKGLFRGSTGCTPMIFIVPPPELLCEDIPGPGCSDVRA
jgi:RHS repeat-associated protein